MYPLYPPSDGVQDDTDRARLPNIVTMTQRMQPLAQPRSILVTPQLGPHQLLLHAAVGFRDIDSYIGVDRSFCRVPNTFHALDFSPLVQQHQLLIAHADSAQALPLRLALPPEQQSQRSNRGTLFPYILHGMLQDVERFGQTDIVSWSADGKAFRVHNARVFVESILKPYFQLHTYEDFCSQLSSWAFQCTDGNFNHPCFLKSHPSLCIHMEQVLPNIAPDEKVC